MYIRLPTLIALSVLFAAPVVARGQTTDEARVLAGKTLPAKEAPLPVPPGTIAQTTDDARALAGRVWTRSQRASPGVIQDVGSTDEARAVAGGLLVVAPPRHEALAIGR